MMSDVFENGREKLWSARDELEKISDECRRVSGSLSSVGLKPPAEALKELCHQLVIIRAKVREAEASMTRDYYELQDRLLRDSESDEQN